MTASPHPASPHPASPSPGWVHLAELGMLRRDDLTIDDLVDLPEDLRYELIDGRLVATPCALPLDQLSRIEAANAIEVHCPDEFVIDVGQMILIDRHNQLRPDVVLIHEQGAGHSPVLPGDVPLIVEVASHPSSSGDRELKLKKCAHAGIPSYWIIDPLADASPSPSSAWARTGSTNAAKSQTNSSPSPTRGKSHWTSRLGPENVIASARRPAETPEADVRAPPHRRQTVAAHLGGGEARVGVQRPDLGHCGCRQGRRAVITRRVRRADPPARAIFR